MSVTLTKEKDNIVNLEITISAKEAMDAYERTVRSVSQNINIDGFRKGKAPKNIVEKQVGIERLKMEAIENLAPKIISKSIEDNKLDVITQPSITSYDFELGKDAVITVQVETRPEVKLGQYKGLKLQVEEVPVAKDGEKQALDNLLNQHAETKTVTDRAANNTDIAVIDFEGSANGEKIVGGDGKNYSLDLGHSNFIPGFAEQIVGKNTGDEFDINVTFPENYHDEKLKGQPATFKIKVNEIKEKVLPELNDEFAKKVGPFKTVDDLKADINKYLETQIEQTNTQNKENEIFKTITETAKVDIPQTMINREVALLKEEYKQRLSYQGITWETLVNAQGGEEKILETLQKDALARIKNSLVIDKIAKSEDIKVDYKDLQQKLTQMSAMYGMKPQDLVKQFGNSPELFASLSQQAINDKVRDYLMNNNEVELVAKKTKK